MQILRGPSFYGWAALVLSGLLMAGGAPPASAAEPKQAAKAGWEQEWKRVVAAAQREAKVVVAGPPGQRYRQVAQEFEKKFPDIRLEWTGLSGRDAGPRILAERQAGQKLWDVHVGGVNTMHTVLKPAGALLEVRPALILPEVKDDKNWHGGLDYGFTDVKKQFVYTFVGNVQPSMHVNRSFVPVAQFNSAKQLLDPRFKGKIVMEDPRAAGAGSRQAATLMSAYGEEFISKLFTQQGVVFSRDLRQLVEWVVRGRYPIGVGNVMGAVLEEFKAQGLGQDIKSVSAPELEVVSSAFGGVGLIEGAPHPNAAKVFLNWLLGRSVQAQWAKLIGDNSRRVDVAPGNPQTVPKPELLSKYIRNDEAWEPVRNKVVKIARTVIK